MKRVFLLGLINTPEKNISCWLNYKAAEKFLKKKGYEVVNPYKKILSEEFDKRTYLLELMTCDSILIIENIDNSCIELKIANELNLTVIQTLQI